MIGECMHSTPTAFSPDLFSQKKWLAADETACNPVSGQNAFCVLQ